MKPIFLSLRKLNSWAFSRSCLFLWPSFNTFSMTFRVSSIVAFSGIRSRIRLKRGKKISDAACNSSSVRGRYPWAIVIGWEWLFNLYRLSTPYSTARNFSSYKCEVKQDADDLNTRESRLIAIAKQISAEFAGWKQSRLLIKRWLLLLNCA